MPVTETGYSERDPRHQAMRLRRMLAEVAERAHDDADTAGDPRARVLFETTHEVLKSLQKAYDDYERKNEQGWR
jgi:hypothetical protein